MHKWITYHMLCVVLDATRSNPLLYAVTDSNIAAAGRQRSRPGDDRSESSGNRAGAQDGYSCKEGQKV